MSDSDNPEYDVAISFLSADEPIALSLSGELSKTLSVFVYSEQQAEIAGKDGPEVFRQVFLSQSRVVVILYREGYGDTRWTRVEETAIKERMLETGWDFLFLVTLDQKQPTWVPSTYLRLDYTKFADDLVGAIKYHVLQLGGQLRIETPVEKSRRMNAAEEARKERIRKLDCEANAVVPVEWEKLCYLLTENGTKIAENIHLKYGRNDRLFGLQSRHASVNISLPELYSREFSIRVHVFIGWFALPDDLNPRYYLPGEGPQMRSEFTFRFDYQAMHEWCWRLDEGKVQYLTTEKLCDFILNTLLDIDQKISSGEIVRRTERSKRAGTEWS